MSQTPEPVDLEFLKSLSVLYVEDEEEVRQALSRFLSRRFARLDVAANGEEGLLAFREHRHDVVVTDIRMPRMDGLTMAEAIKDISQEVPVVVITAYNEVEYFQRAIEIGVDRYITKPVNTDLLLFAIVKATRVRFHQREVEEARAATLEAMNQVVAVLARAIESRDPYTDGHQKRVANLAAAIAAELGLATDRQMGIRLGSTIHDIGKIQVPAELLSMPRKLSDAEFALIKEHVQAGYDILGNAAFPWPIADMVHQHHERLDGSGYPQGLRGDEIILEARIIAVADVVEAMSSHRPYRAALGLERAMAELRANRGLLYDDAVVNACLRLLERDPGHFLVL